MVSSVARRVGIYGWGIVAPGARDIASFQALFSGATTALAPSGRLELGSGLFAVGEPDFAFKDYAAWIKDRHGEPYAVRLDKKMGDNVKFAVGATIQAVRAQPGMEAAIKELDEGCHVYIGSGVGDLKVSYKAGRLLDRATRVWNQFWAMPEHCTALRHYLGTGQGTGTLLGGESREPPPPNPQSLPVDSEARFDALLMWNEYWAARSAELHAFCTRYADIEKLAIQNTDDESGHLAAIRARARAHRALVEEAGCPPPPWVSVDADLIWNIQNSPAAQITMLLGIHGPAWAPVGACSTFGVALACGKQAIERGEAKMAIVGSTDPRPDSALAAAFHGARLMPGTGEVNYPFMALRGTHMSGGSCVWVIGDAAYCEAKGMVPLAYLEAVAISSDAEHIITPSKSGPKRAMARAFAEAHITPKDVAVVDLHATGTPGDLNELMLVDEFINDRTLITAHKGQLGHGMANSGGWELTALAMGLSSGIALPTGIAGEHLHPRVTRPAQVVTSARKIEGDIGVKIMLGIGGITACVVLRGCRPV
ncbi:MAG: beta-ketoacyl synthase [Polyangiaceae bacterium]|nr:beta-ketoacyl synthase [Polyangiaceae bacterium]